METQLQKQETVTLCTPDFQLEICVLIILSEVGIDPPGLVNSPERIRHALTHPCTAPLSTKVVTFLFSSDYYFSTII